MVSALILTAFPPAGTLYRMKNGSKKPRYLTPNQVARYLSVTPRNVYSLISQGKLPAVRVGGNLRVHRRDLSAFIKGNRTVKPPEPVKKAGKLSKKDMAETQRILDELL